MQTNDYVYFEDREWRQHQERVDKFNQQFWANNNEMFILAKHEFEMQSNNSNNVYCWFFLKKIYSIVYLS